MNSQEVRHLIQFIEEFDDDKALVEYLASAWIVFSNQQVSSKHYVYPAYFRDIKMAMEYAEMLGIKTAHEIHDRDLTKADLSDQMTWDYDEHQNVVCYWYSPLDPYPPFGTPEYEAFVPKFAIGISKVIFKG